MPTWRKVLRHESEMRTNDKMRANGDGSGRDEDGIKNPFLKVNFLVYL